MNTTVDGHTAGQNRAIGAQPWLLLAGAGAAWAILATTSHVTPGHGPGSIATFMPGWLLMVAAMMVPSTAPVLRMLDVMTNNRSVRTSALAGYIIVWGIFGGVAFAVAWAAFGLAQLGGPVAQLAPGAVLFGAGAFQFTPLKNMCLTRCRSPRMQIVPHWHGQSAPREALTIGLHSGLYCLGCCWALMLIMVALGSTGLLWMVAAAAVMAAEKNAPWGARFSAPLGWGLMAIGVAWMAYALTTTWTL